MTRRRTAIIAASVALAAAITGVTAVEANADTQTSYSYSTATATPVVVTNVKSTAAVTNKITLENTVINGFRTSAKCIRATSFSAGNGYKCITITKNGVKFENSGITASGARFWFADYVGSADSKAGTASATFYYDANAKTWRKQNCGNYVKFSGYSTPKYSITQINMVTTLTTTWTATLSSTGRVDVTATAVCATANTSASATATATATATVNIVVKVQAKTSAQATAASKALAAKQTSAILAQAKQAATITATSTTKLTAAAQAQTSCTEITPPPVVTPPTPPVVTPPPAPQVPIVSVLMKNDVDLTYIDPNTKEPKEGTTQITVNYTVAPGDTASLQLSAGGVGSFRDPSQSLTNLQGQNTLTATYVAPTEGSSATITVTIYDPNSGSTTSTPITITLNPHSADSPPNA